jgi:hypothetical protein
MYFILLACGGGAMRRFDMKNASESLAGSRESLLQWELEVVQAAMERAARAQEESCVSRDWSAKLQKYRDELEGSLRRRPDCAV